MEDTKPHALARSEWEEIMQVPVVRESWGIDGDTTLEDFMSQVYAAKFEFVSGSPGYVGDLFILQGDMLTGDPPFVTIRNRAGKLEVI